MTLEIGVTEDIAACQAVRHAVFCVEQGVALDVEQDGRDATAHHVLARQDGTPVGAARILIAGDAGKIGRVCVLPACRGRGIGAELIRACLSHLKNREGVRRAELAAQTHVLDFYTALGFTPVGAEFKEIGVPHQRMERPL